MQPTFSVVIPLYNKQAYIATTIQSVLKQSLPAHEVIVVDDGSTDDSVETLARLGDRIRLIQQENSGESATRERGALEARGNWVAFLDADDLWLPNHLEELAATINSFPNAAMVSTAHRKVPDREIAEGRLPSSRGSGARRHSIDYFVEAAKKIGIVSSSSAAIRADVLRQPGSFPRFGYGADLAIWAKVALNHPVAHSTRITAIYRTESGGYSDQTFSRSRSQVLAVPRSIGEISPCSSVIYDAIASGEYSVPEGSLWTYINGRLAFSVRTALSRGDGASAKSLANLQYGSALIRHRIFIRLVKTAPTSAPPTVYDWLRSSSRNVQQTLVMARGRKSPCNDLSADDPGGGLA